MSFYTPGYPITTGIFRTELQTQYLDMPFNIGGLKMGEGETVREERKQSRSGRLDYPTIPLETALEVCKAIKQVGGKASSYQIISDALHVKGGSLNTRISSARRYGLIDSKELINTDLVAKILNPIGPGEDLEAEKRAILSVGLFKEIYNKFGTDLPEENLFKNILHREFGVPEKSVQRVLYAIRKNFELVGPKQRDFTQEAEGSHVKWDDGSEQSEASKSRFPIKIASQHGSFTFDITDEVDWEAVESYIKALKNKWSKSNPEE
jgi:hypothetical protein